MVADRGVGGGVCFAGLRGEGVVRGGVFRRDLGPEQHRAVFGAAGTCVLNNASLGQH